MRDHDLIMPGDGDATRSALLLRTLERLLAIGVVGLRPALDEASTLLAESLGADKVDVFLYEAATDSLVAVGTSHTPMGDLQRAMGLDRQPLSNGGLAARVFRTGEAYITGRADQEAEELRGIVEGMGARSELLAPLTVRGERRGVFAAAHGTVDRFDARDAAFARAATDWVGLVLDRAETADRLAAEAERRGRRAAGDELARLTRREQAIAAAVAEGLSNAELAHRLEIEEGTAANHVARALLKLGLRNRTQLAVWAAERGLYRPDALDGHDPGDPPGER